jgi:uncharacterized protein
MGVMNNNNMISLFVSESIGTVSAECVIPPTIKAVLTLAHGAGADMNHRFMKALADELGKKDIASLRFNFPYMENKKKIPDPPAIAEKAVQAALHKAHELFPDKPVFATGKSFGGRMSSQYLSKHKHEFVKGAIYFGFPLHAPGKPSIDRAAHLSSVTVPMLFLQGTKDTLAQLNLIRGVADKLPGATLSIFEGADHSFKAGKKEFISELAGRTSEWIDRILQ